MFPDNRTLMKALKVLLSSNNFYTAIYMCAWKPKNEASITFALTTKASRNRTMLHKEFFFFQRCGNPISWYSLTVSIKVREARQNAVLTYMVIPGLSY